MSDIVEKLKQIKGLIDECISAQGAGEYEEEESEEESSPSESIGGGDDAGDKIKLAATMLKKRMG
jgi:hypothetical protein